MSRPNDKSTIAPAPADERRQILLHLDGGLIKDLKKAAVDLETSASAIANEAVDDWLAKRGLRKSDGNT
ncbi:MAG: hypothetical protein E5X67_08830 [Mesorhizobium sp.]|uniref:hypothetical protein n=1 Tax=Mesorhizobium sp. TaxID=1871066 RepID=UPI000FE83F69|nr:hypothetical protein [Mesorhizobium sp.]RWP15967.1 MAG: hypothetical protein EOR01_28310 [Mesorhizobium sp.]TIP29060.1 MAG: hypothetical protein E5X67_08830 [Mesorhizobium sp.]